jgi:hypothetical protein
MHRPGSHPAAIRLFVVDTLGASISGDRPVTGRIN